MLDWAVQISHHTLPLDSMAAQLVQGKLCKKPQLYVSFWQQAYCVCYSELALISDPVSAFYRAVAGTETSMPFLTTHFTKPPAHCYHFQG